MKALKKIVSLLLTLALILTGVNISDVKVSKAEGSFENFACYSDGCKLVDKNHYADVSIKGNKLYVSGWIYKSKTKGNIDYMKWEKIEKSYSVSSKIFYWNLSPYEEITKKEFFNKFKKYGKSIDCIAITRENGAVSNRSIGNVSDTVKESAEITDGECRVYSKGSAGHYAGEICPLEFGKVSISNGNLVVKGIIACYDNSLEKDIRIKTDKIKFKIKCKVNKKLKNEIKKLKNTNENDTFCFCLENGKVISMYCGSSFSV
ncbi:MAG: hypothetical protein OSJ66_08975 [Clostridia bacterium]|nr:hypothetical protein [Clostridia bacterium]